MCCRRPLVGCQTRTCRGGRARSRGILIGRGFTGRGSTSTPSKDQLRLSRRTFCSLQLIGRRDVDSSNARQTRRDSAEKEPVVGEKSRLCSLTPVGQFSMHYERAPCFSGSRL